MSSTISNTLILVLDASSSMSQFNQLELLKVLQTANEQENIGRLVIIQFSDECSIVLDEQVQWKQI